MQMFETTIPPLGLGCWPLGGPFFAGEKPLGYANASDEEAVRTIHAAYDAGIRLFDTAAVYGAGNAERLLGETLHDRPDALIVTKIGIAFDEETRQVTGDETDPAQVRPAVERCLRRLRRDRIDLLLLHQNALPLAQARPIFEEMGRLREAGLVRAFGWSTDFPASVDAMVDTAGFEAVEFAANVFVDVPTMQGTVDRTGMLGLIRSPLAMGVLGGRYDGNSTMEPTDIRSTNEDWKAYFRNGRVEPDFLRQLDAVRELLQTGGRTLTQGSLGWLMARSDRYVPVPGARTPAQIVDSAQALQHGPLPDDVMQQIEAVLDRPPEGPPQER